MVYCYMCGRDHDPKVGCSPSYKKEFVKSTYQPTFLERIGLNMTKKELWSILISTFVGLIFGYALFHPFATTSGGIIESKIPIMKTLEKTNDLLDGMGKTLESIKKDQELLHEQQNELLAIQNDLRRQVESQRVQLESHDSFIKDNAKLNEDIDNMKSTESDISKRIYELEKEAKSHKWSIEPKEPTLESNKEINTVQENK